jgi:transposase InsO family protein
MKKYPDLRKGFDFESSNLLWVSDITYIRVKGEFAYLSLITDGYSHKVIEYCPESYS